MFTYAKDKMTEQAMAICGDFPRIFIDNGDSFTIAQEDDIPEDMGMSINSEGKLDINDATGVTLGYMVEYDMLPMCGIINLYYKDTDNLMQYGLKREVMWSKQYLSDPLSEWYIDSNTIALDCVVKEFYYNIECGMFIIVIDEPKAQPVEITGCLTRSKKHRVEINPTITLEIPEGMTADEETENFFNLLDTVKGIWYANAKHTVYEVE